MGSSPTRGILPYFLGKTILSGRNRTSDPVIADIYSHMLYQLSYAELLSKVEMQGIDPCTSRMLSERSTI